MNLREILESIELEVWPLIAFLFCFVNKNFEIIASKSNFQSIFICLAPPLDQFQKYLMPSISEPFIGYRTKRKSSCLLVLHTVNLGFSFLGSAKSVTTCVSAFQHLKCFNYCFLYSCLCLCGFIDLKYLFIVIFRALEMGLYICVQSANAIFRWKS